MRPGTYLFVPMHGNLKATIKTEKELKMSKHACIFPMDREVPALFWSENLNLDLASDGKRIYTFKTKYIQDFSEILPSDYLKNVPRWAEENFLADVPSGIIKLANKLAGNEKDTVKILEKFYYFIVNHMQVELITMGKPLEQLLDEYANAGCFYGNCKEAKTFLMGLCNAKGFPTKGVYGKSLRPLAHVWTDVFVPVEGGYKLLPIDGALGYFGYHDCMSHLLFEPTPAVSGLLANAFNIGHYQLSIEKAK